jgi:hypothetical protein
MKPQSESEKFDAALDKILSVSHDELKRREAEWERQRKRKKRIKTSPASHVTADRS